MDGLDGLDKWTKRQRDKAIKDIMLNTISFKTLIILIIAIFREEKNLR